MTSKDTSPTPEEPAETDAPAAPRIRKWHENEVSPPRPWHSQELLSEPEGMAIEAFRLWTKAQTDPELTARLDAWSALQYEVPYAAERQRRIKEGLEKAETAESLHSDPELDRVAIIVSEFIEARTAQYLTRYRIRYQSKDAKDARAAQLNTASQRFDDANGFAPRPVTSVDHLIYAIPERPYPTGFKTFASCHEVYSEARRIDATFFGTRLSEIRLKPLLLNTETSFLIPEAALYFWPKILLALYGYPDSQFAHAFYALNLRSWQRPENPHDAPRRLPSLMNNEEKAATYAVLSSVLSQIGPKRERAIVEDVLIRFKDWGDLL